MLSRLAKAIKRGFRGIGKKGYTLLEVAAVVAVTGTLAAVAMPVVADKIAAGKLVAAQQEVQSIRDLIIYFIKDTMVPPFYPAAYIASKGLVLPKLDDTDYYYGLKTSDGVDVGAKSDITDWPSGSYWGILDEQLIKNTPKYPTEGISAWKGPYVPSLKKDPWGNRYCVAIRWLAESPTTGDFGKKQYAVYVLSAGPNGLIETNFQQQIRDIEREKGTYGDYTFKVGGDDIVSRIQ